MDRQHGRTPFAIVRQRKTTKPPLCVGKSNSGFSFTSQFRRCDQNSRCSRLIQRCRHLRGKLTQGFDGPPQIEDELRCRRPGSIDFYFAAVLFELRAQFRRLPVRDSCCALSAQTTLHTASPSHVTVAMPASALNTFPAAQRRASQKCNPITPRPNGTQPAQPKPTRKRFSVACRDRS